MADGTIELPRGRGGPRRTPGRAARSLAANPQTAFGAFIVALHLVLAVASPLLAPHSVSALVAAPMQLPGPDFWLGTDQLGRDYFSRIVSGGRVAIAVSMIGVSIAVVAGTVLGLIASYRGGRFDEIIMRMVDTVTALPELILIAILTLSLGSGTAALIAVVAIVYAPGVVRVVRARTVSLAALDFVRSAELRGETTGTVLFRELLPNLRAILGVEFAVRTSSAILKISALSFLGLGISQPTPDWGLMVQEAMGAIYTDPWLLLFPALMLSSLIVGLNFLVDGLTRTLGLSNAELE